MLYGLDGQADEIWKRIRQEAREIARAEIAAALRNLRPGGVDSWAVVVGGGVTASLTEQVAQVHIPAPCWVERVELLVQPTAAALLAGVWSATVDLWVARPGLDLDLAASICGANLPDLADVLGNTVLPAADWTRMIEAGSALVYYVTEATGIQTLTVNVVVRCL